MMKKEFEMADSEQLVHRFLDQELSSAERVRFLVRLGHDHALRRQLIELEQLALDVSRLRRPPVPDGFVAGVLERTAKADPLAVSSWRRLTDAMWAPRALQWNLAGAVAAGLALLALGGLLAAGLSGPRVLAPGRVGDRPISAISAPDSRVLVRLVVLHPGATTVQAAGDFNGWNPARTPLEQLSNGAWTVTIPLEPGRYEYMFVVDGDQWIGDPFAVEQADDGFGARNAVLDVRLPAGAPL